ncbi:MAG: response regulator [Oligoflexia bacterium]|nr:response regulator [Oligoflexia bacterium]
MSTELKPILLAEDDARDAELITEALKGSGLANLLIRVKDGVVAMEYLRAEGEFKGRKSGNPAVVILDIKMPRMDGLDVLQSIRNDPLLKFIPVVMLTSSLEEQDLIQSYQKGTNAYVLKPVKFSEFIEAMKNIGVFWGIINKLPQQMERQYIKRDLYSTENETETETETNTEKRPLRILHIEDSPNDAEIILNQLNVAGISVQIDLALNEAQFTSFIQNSEYDLILADYNLPGLNGMTILRTAKSLSPHVPIIFVTGAIGEDMAVELIKQGATDYVLKDRPDKLPLAILRAMEEVQNEKVKKEMEGQLEEKNKKLLKSNQLLEKSQKLLLDVEKMTNIGGWELDVETQQQVWTEEVYRIHELDMATYKPTLDKAKYFYPPTTSRPIVEQAVQRAIDYGEPFDLELDFISAKGNHRFIHTVGKVEQENGKTKKVFGIFRDITLQKQGEEKLHLLSVIDSNISETAVLIRASDSTIVYTNQSFNRMFGYDPGEILGKHINVLNFAISEKENKNSDMEGIDNEIINRLATNGSWSGEVLNVKKDGTPFWCHTNIITLDHPEYGRVWLKIHKDITDQKRIEKKLKEAEAILMTAMNQGPVGVVIANAPDGLIQYVNNAGLAIGGGNKETLANGIDISKYISSWRLLRPDGTAIEEDEIPLVRAIKYGETFSNEFIIRRGSIEGKDDRIIWANAAPVIDDNGHIMAGVVLFLDITEYRRTKEELDVMTNTGEAVSLIRLSDGIIIHSNSIFEKMFGAEPREYMGKHFSTIIAAGTDDINIHYIDLEKNSQEIAKDIIDHVNKNGHWQGDHQGIKKDGTIFWCHANISVFNHSKYGRVLITVHRDITEYRHIVDEHMELERRLLHAQKLESIGVLAGGIAHDFNNLLMTIAGNIDLAKSYTSTTSVSYSCLESALNATKRAADLTRQMLAYAGKGKFNIVEFSLNELLTENSEIFRASIPRTTIFDLQLSPNLPLISGDSGQIQQIIMNLITNAAEAIDNRPGTITLKTGVQFCDEAILQRSRVTEIPAAGEFVYLEVTDTGCGMDKETLEKLFDPFFTTKFAGRGLGMSALQGIIKEHYGAIIVDSKIGVGTTIRVFFPVMVATMMLKDKFSPISLQEEKEEILTDSPHYSSVSTPSLKKLETILIVDDDAAICNICRIMVEVQGYQAMVAADGEEAIEIFRTHTDTIKYVLLDLTMPKIDGYETFKILKQIRPDVKVIISSGYGEESATKRFTGLGLAGFLQKPYQIEKLRNELKRLENLYLH